MCYRPNMMFYNPKSNPDRHGWRFLGRVTDYTPSQEDYDRYKLYLQMVKNVDGLDQFVPFDIKPFYIYVPCGTCDECRKKKMQDWIYRNCMESEYHDRMCVITLTYKGRTPEFNSLERRKIDASGKLLTYHSLDHAHFQKFFKRLRKAHPELTLKYFMCGEYGDKHFRPHMHAIIYGYAFPDKIPDGTSEKGNVQYISDELDSLWKLGRATIGEFSPDSVAYVASYSLKKKLSRNDYYRDLDLKPPYVVASKHLGRQYLLDHPDIMARFVNYFGDGKYSTPYYSRYLIDVLSDENPLKDKYLKKKIKQAEIGYLRACNELQFYGSYEEREKTKETANKTKYDGLKLQSL